MSRPTPQDFITWANALAQFPWPIELNDFAPYAEQLGWKPTPLPDEFSVCDDSDVEDVILGVIRSEEICDLFLVVVRNETEDFEGAAELNDHFVSCVAAGREAWGEPFLLEAGEDPAAAWRLLNGSFAQFSGGGDALLLRFVTPQGWWRFA